MNVRLLVCRFIWDDGFGSISDALECLRLCREEGAMVSTNSWGGVPHSSESHACCCACCACCPSLLPFLMLKQEDT
jgi:hypothetical protein